MKTIYQAPLGVTDGYPHIVAQEAIERGREQTLEILVEAKRRFHTDALFHARAIAAANIVADEQYAHEEEPNQSALRLAAAVALVLSERNLWGAASPVEP